VDGVVFYYMNLMTENFLDFERGSTRTILWRTRFCKMIWTCHPGLQRVISAWHNTSVKVMPEPIVFY